MNQPLNLSLLRIELARRGWTRLELARRLGHPPSTVSTWLRSVAPAPTDLVARIESVMDLEPGALGLCDAPEEAAAAPKAAPSAEPSTPGGSGVGASVRDTAVR